MTLTGSGCASLPEVRYVTRPLTAPARPLLPILKAEDLMCLKPDAYRRLVERERLRRQYAEQLEALVQSTRPETDANH